MADDHDTQQARTRTALVDSSRLEGKDGPPSSAPSSSATGETPAPASRMIEAPDLQGPALPIADPDDAKEVVGKLALFLREAQSDAATHKSLATALTRSLRELREENETITRRLGDLEKELLSLRADREDLEGAVRKGEEDRVAAGAQLASSERARSESEEHIHRLQDETLSLRRRVEELIRERDEALLRRADAVRSAMDSVRKAIQEQI